MLRTTLSVVSCVTCVGVLKEQRQLRGVRATRARAKGLQGENVAGVGECPVEISKLVVVGWWCLAASSPTTR